MNIVSARQDQASISPPKSDSNQIKGGGEIARQFVMAGGHTPEAFDDRTSVRASSS
jgi:hypothetical protein